MEPSYRVEDPYFLTQEERATLEFKHSIFRDITDEFPVHMGKEASRKEREVRNDLTIADATLTYGEVDFTSIGEVFLTIQNRYGGIPTGGVFYDLGSGTGKGVIAAALLHQFDECRGVEILGNLCSISYEMKQKYDSVFPARAAERPDIWPKVPAVNFFEKDFFEYDWSDAGFIFANSTCYDGRMMERIAANPVNKGILGISFTKNFSESHWEILESIKKNMSWGEATVYIQRKIDPREPPHSS